MLAASNEQFFNGFGAGVLGARSRSLNFTHMLDATQVLHGACV